MAAMVQAIAARLDELCSRFGDPRFETVYIGGGTPSLLPRPSLRTLLSRIAAHAPAPREWSVEANPESLDESFLDLLEEAGATRISLGVQTLDDERLRELGRPADAATALRALRLASRRPLALSADLIAGFGRRLGLAEEARILAEEGAGHLSIYDLTLEEGTVLEARERRGEFSLQGEDEAAGEREEAETLLAGRGFRRYEVSNYALPGRESIHNLVYWRMGSWLGVGPGASGTLIRSPEPGPPRPGLSGGGLRIEEAPSLRAYLEGRAAGAARESEISPYDAAFETLMMGFRTLEGIDLVAFSARFGLGLEELIEGSLAAWAPRLSRKGGRLRLDGRGLDLLNRFLADCLGELEAKFPRPGAGLAD